MDGDMKRNRLFLIILCAISACMVIYHAFLWFALNAPPEEAKLDRIGSAPMADGDAPSLSEEARLAQEFENDTYPALHETILAEAGFDIPVEVDWASLAAKGWSHIYMTAFPKVYFLPLIRALKSYAAEAPEGNGARRILKKIVIKNSGRNFSSNGIDLDEGVLVIDLQPQANVDEGETERSDRILELLRDASR